MSNDSSWIETMPETYDRCLGPALFTPYASHVAELVAARAPRRVLELAAGTGILTAELARLLPDARITATDLNPEMVSWAAHRVANVDWRQADAQRLDYPEASFELVVCQFGVMFFPDKQRAFAEAARVLVPGGTMLFTVWDVVDGSEFAAALVSTAADLLPEDPPMFLVRIPHGYNDPDKMRSDVRAGGLYVEAIDRVVLRGTAESARTVVEGYGLGTPMRFELEERGSLDVLTEALADELARRLGPGPLEGDITALVVSARKP